MTYSPTNKPLLTLPKFQYKDLPSSSSPNPQSIIYLRSLNLSQSIAMVKGSFSDEAVWHVNIDRLWKARIMDLHTLLPRLLPGFIAKMEVNEKDGAGTVLTLNFNEAVTEFRFVKHKVVALNSDSYTVKDVVIDGGFLGSKLKSYSFDHKFEAVNDSSTLVKVTVEYETLDGASFTAKDQKRLVEMLNGTTKAIEDYVNSNPTAYN